RRHTRYKRDWSSDVCSSDLFKLRRGAGSAHVKLANSKDEAKKLVNKAFGRGFSQYDKIRNLKDRWYQYRNNNVGLWNVMKGVLRSEERRVGKEGRDRGWGEE